MSTILGEVHGVIISFAIASDNIEKQSSESNEYSLK